jgi:hypothetical protein
VPSVTLYKAGRNIICALQVKCGFHCTNLYEIYGRLSALMGNICTEFDPGILSVESKSRK